MQLIEGGLGEEGLKQFVEARSIAYVLLNGYYIALTTFQWEICRMAEAGGCLANEGDLKLKALSGATGASNKQKAVGNLGGQSNQNPKKGKRKGATGGEAKRVVPHTPKEKAVAMQKCRTRQCRVLACKSAPTR